MKLTPFQLKVVALAECGTLQHYFHSTEQLRGTVRGGPRFAGLQRAVAKLVAAGILKRTGENLYVVLPPPPSPVAVGALRSPRWKLVEVAAHLNAGLGSKTEGPIEISKCGRGVYYVVNGNHRALAAISAGHSTIDAFLSRSIPDMLKCGSSWAATAAEAVSMTEWVAAENAPLKRRKA